MGTPLDQQISVAFAGALAFGVYFATLLSCFRWLLFADEGWKRRRVVNWPIVVVAFFIFGINVVREAWRLHWLMVEASLVVGNPAVRFVLPDSANIVACTLENSNILLADMVLIHRCWVVHGRRKRVVVFPIFMWLVALLCTILQIYLQVAHMKNPDIGPYTWASVNMTIGPGIVLLPFWISTVLLNAYASSALILRIHQVARQCRLIMSTTHLHFFIRVIAESGLFCLSITLAHLLVWFGKSGFAVDTVAALNTPIVGIAFNWFIIRVATNKAEAAKTPMGEKITTLRFKHSETRMQFTNAPVSAGAVFELIVASDSNTCENSGGTGSSGTIDIGDFKDTAA